MNTLILIAMIVFAQLAVAALHISVKKELKEALLTWTNHFNVMNYTGVWAGIALRTAEGREGSIIPQMRAEDVFKDHANMVLFPSVKRFLDKLECPVGSVRLLNLSAGASIKPHHDYELCFEQGEVRLHVPLLTNPGVEFYVHDQQVVMKENECWYINANLKHHVSNKGNTDRIHLVIDCKVNDWLKALMNAAVVIRHAPDYSLQQLNDMIFALRAQNSVIANHQADELQRQYDNYPVNN